MQGNWATGLLERFDLILCNPPYIAEGAELGPGVREFEPDEALFAGREGLDAYRELAPQLPRLLNPGGLAAIEIAPDQVELGSRSSRSRRAAGEGRERPRRPPSRGPVNLGLREKRLASAVGRTTSVSWAGPAPLES